MKSTTPSSADERALFEAHIQTTSWYAVLFAAKDDDDEGASVFRMALMAAREAWDAGRASLGAAQVPSLSDAQSRVAAFLAEYAKRRGLHPEEIYSLGLGEGALMLLASDLAALSQPSQQGQGS